MPDKIIYLTVSVKLSSTEAITDDVIQQFQEETDYSFTSKTEGVKVEATQIIDVSKTCPGLSSF